MSGHPESTNRQGFRFRTGVPAEFRDAGTAITCEAQNISRSGALLVGDFQPPSTEIIEFTLRAPSGSLAVNLVGRIIRVSPNTGGDGLRMGLEYVDLTAEQRDTLELLLARLLETPTGGPFDHLKPGASTTEIKKALDAIPLPQRVALASRANAKDREYLRADTNPGVLEALAHNPHLTVAEACALASSQHVLAGTLETLANDTRLHTDEELFFTIARHPRISPVTIEKIVTSLKVPQLKRLLTKPGLNQILREKLIKKTNLR